MWIHVCRMFRVSSWNWHGYLLHMKYSRHTSHFIGLVHIFMLYTRSLYWLIHDNCILDTMPDAYFACYRLAHDNGKCTNCIIHLSHGIWQSIVSVGISFLRVSAEFFANLSFYPCPHISWFCGLDNLAKFPRLELESGTGTWTHISAMVNHVLYYNCYPCNQIMCSIKMQ